MKVTLATEYRLRMFVLLPTTLGFGTVILWIRSLRWPSSVDADGLTLRYRRKIPWKSIERINVWRDYCDGHLSQIDIHHHGSIDKIPLHALRDGESIAGTILATFKQARRFRLRQQVKSLDDVGVANDRYSNDSDRHSNDEEPLAAEPPFPVSWLEALGGLRDVCNVVSRQHGD